MKSVPYIAAIAIVGLFAADTALAQQGPGRGAGFGRFMSPEASAEVICDVLLLDEERAEKVKAAYLEAMEGQEGLGGMQGFQDMTAEERREAMQAIRDRQADTVTEALKDLVDEDESKAVHNVVATSRFVVIPEVRALRLVGIESEKRDELLSSVIEVVEARPVIGFGGAGQRGGQGGGPGGGSEAAREAQEKLEALNAKIATVLSADQVEAWKEKTQEIEEEQERLREEMRQRAPGGGGGQRGGGGRQG